MKMHFQYRHRVFSLKEGRLIHDKEQPKQSEAADTQQSEQVDGKAKVLAEIQAKNGLEGVVKCLEDIKRDAKIETEEVGALSEKFIEVFKSYFNGEEMQRLKEALPTTVDEVFTMFGEALSALVPEQFADWQQQMQQVKQAKEEAPQTQADVGAKASAPIEASRPGPLPAGHSVDVPAVRKAAGEAVQSSLGGGATMSPENSRATYEAAQEQPEQTVDLLVQNYLEAKQQHKELWDKRRDITREYRRLRGRSKWAAKSSYLAALRNLTTAPLSKKINSYNTEFKQRFGMNIAEFALMAAGEKEQFGMVAEAEGQLSPRTFNRLLSMGVSLGDKFERDQRQAEAMDRTYRQDAKSLRSSFARATRNYKPGRGQAMDAFVKWDRLGRGPLADEHIEKRRLRRELGIPKGGYAPESDIRYRMHLSKARAQGNEVFTRGSTYAYIDRTGAMGRYLRDNPRYRSQPRQKNYWEQKGLIPAIRGVPLSTSDTFNGTVYLGPDRHGKGALERQVTERDLEYKSVGSFEQSVRDGQVAVRIPKLEGKRYNPGQLVFLKLDAASGGSNIYSGRLKERLPNGSYRVQMDSPRLRFKEGTTGTVHLPDGASIIAYEPQKPGKNEVKSRAPEKKTPATPEPEQQAPATPEPEQQAPATPEPEQKAPATPEPEQKAPATPEPEQKAPDTSEQEAPNTSEPAELKPTPEVKDADELRKAFLDIVRGKGYEDYVVGCVLSRAKDYYYVTLHHSGNAEPRCTIKIDTKTRKINSVVHNEYTDISLNVSELGGKPFAKQVEHIMDWLVALPNRFNQLQKDAQEVLGNDYIIKKDGISGSNIYLKVSDEYGDLGMIKVNHETQQVENVFDENNEGIEVSAKNKKSSYSEQVKQAVQLMKAKIRENL